MNYKKYYTLLILLTSCLVMQAQPSSVKKAAKSIVKITTFKADGTIQGTGYGAFTDANGTVIGAWKPFVGASTASVIDAQGKKYDVDCLYGASEYYNVARIKVKVPQKNNVTPAPLEQGALNDGEEAWYAGYAAKNPSLRRYNVTRVETFMTDMPYYIIEQDMNPVGDDMQGSPFFNAKGELMGIMNSSSTRTDLYVAAARYAQTLAPTALSINDNTLRGTALRIALPEDYNQALLAMMMVGQRNDTLNYEPTVNNFIEMFPDKEDGYINKAEYLTSKHDFQGADNVIQEAMTKCENKEALHFAYSRMILSKETMLHDIPYEGWSLDKALEECNKAYALSPQLLYRAARGKIYLAMEKYQEALEDFKGVTKDGFRDDNAHYSAFACMKTLDIDKREQLEQLDSAIAIAPRMYIYHAERTLLLLKMHKVQEAAMGAQTMIRMAPTHSEGRAFLGVALCMAGKKERGLQELNRAKAMGFESADGFIKKYVTEEEEEKNDGN